MGVRAHALSQFEGRRDLFDGDTWIDQRTHRGLNVRCHERHIRAPARCLVGKFNTHPSRRVIGDETDRINRFTCATCRDNHGRRSDHSSGAGLGETKPVRTASAISPGSLILPTPVSAPVRRPLAGPMNFTPRSASVLTLASWVARLFHISVCIAGAMRIGQVATRADAVSRLSAIPTAIFAIVLAVAGAMSIRVGFLSGIDVDDAIRALRRRLDVDGMTGQCLPRCLSDEIQRRRGGYHDDVDARRA